VCESSGGFLASVNSVETEDLCSSVLSEAGLLNASCVWISNNSMYFLSSACSFKSQNHELNPNTIVGFESLQSPCVFTINAVESM